LGRAYYEHGAATGAGYRNGYWTGRMKTAEGPIAYAASQVANRQGAFRSALRDGLQGRTRPPGVQDHESAGAAVPGEGPAAQDHPQCVRRKAVLKLMYGAMIRAAERWRGLPLTDFERRQLEAIQAELDAEYQASIGRPPAAPQPKVSSTQRP
jgi:hypothetical protein